MFLTKLNKLQDIDRSGSDTYRRFEYQIACVFLTLLTLYKKTENFFVLLDYIDDFVVVQDENTSDETISFVQVKTQKDKPISIHTVIKNDWILKQAENYKEFVDDNVKNILMTNLGISIKNHIVSSTEIVSLDNYKDYEAIKELKTTILEKTGIDNLKDFYLVKAALSLESFKNEIKGKMLEYILNNNLKDLTAEAIETIYFKIWNILTEKQRCIIDTNSDKSELDIISKKGIKYSYVKDVFRVALDIQLPDFGKIYEFCSKYNVYYGEQKLQDFGKDFRSFRIDSAKNGFKIIEESLNFLRDNKNLLPDSNDVFEFSKNIFIILESYDVINSSEFYKRYKYCISVFLTYKYVAF